MLERAGWVPLACIIGALLIIASASITWNTSPYYGRNDARAATAPAATSANAGTVPATGGKYSVSLSPNRIEIPKLKTVAPIVKVATSANGELEVPENPKVTGWWSPGARPGAAVGTSVITGHVNYAGVDGALGHIGNLAPGDKVVVLGKYNAKKMQVTFTVVAVRTYHKTALPYREIFNQKSVGRLALVTCGGPFDASTGNYLDNIVVYAVPTSSSAA
ncbi:MAG: class F sortase [Jatrophihabitans sp.]